VTVFGLFEMPPIWPKNRAFSERLFFIHSVIGIALALSGGRAHQRGALPPFRAKDHVLLRMLTSLKAQADRPMPAQSTSAAVQSSVWQRGLAFIPMFNNLRRFDTNS